MGHKISVYLSKYYPYALTKRKYTFHSLFITSCSTFRLIKAFIKKVFLSMSHSLHTAYAHHFENGGHKQCGGYVTLKEKLFIDKGFQNGGHKQCGGYVTLKEKLS